MALGTNHVTLTEAQGGTGRVTSTSAFIPELWTDEVIASYKANLVMAPLVQHMNFVGRKGDNVHVPRPVRGAASAKTAENQVTLIANDFHVWATGGLETMMFALAGVAAILVTRLDSSARRDWMAGAVVRPSGVLRPSAAMDRRLRGALGPDRRAGFAWAAVRAADAADRRAWAAIPREAVRTRRGASFS